jgi:transposase-like protein
LAEYEGHDDRPSSLTRHRFHCHSCGRVYLLQSTSHKPPVFAIQPRHEIQEETSH